MFERYGRVSSVRLATDRSTGRPRGFAFVTMSRLDDGDEAIVRLNGSNFSGRQIVVNESRDAGTPARPANSENRSRVVNRLDLL